MVRAKKDSLVAAGKKITVDGDKIYKNLETNEDETVHVIQIKKKSMNVEKVWLTSILQTLDIIGNQKLKIIDFMLKIKTTDHLIVATQRVIAEKSDVSLPIVNETIKLLIKFGFLKKINSGAYLMNAKYLVNNKDGDSINILYKYDKS